MGVGERMNESEMDTRNIVSETSNHEFPWSPTSLADFPLSGGYSFSATPPPPPRPRSTAPSIASSNPERLKKQPGSPFIAVTDASLLPTTTTPSEKHPGANSRSTGCLPATLGPQRTVKAGLFRNQCGCQVIYYFIYSIFYPALSSSSDEPI